MANKKDAFVKVPLWFAAAAAKATGDPTILVLAHMLHASWKAHSMTFRLSNSYLTRNGVSRKSKSRVLHELEAAGLIMIEQKKGRSPLVTLIVI
jgi:hypothetical protein